MVYEQIGEAVDFIRKKSGVTPEIGIILGTGLSNLSKCIETVCQIPYAEIPHFPVSTAPGHEGKLIFGHLDGFPLVVMSGRFHYYEGYSMEQIGFPVRVMKFLGIKRLIVSSASGSVNPDYRAGDVVIVRDHINMLPGNPLRGDNDPRLGPRFPDLLHTYDMELCEKAMTIARENNIKAHLGVYTALQGPNLETPAEYIFMNRIGSDLVGMSTVPEVLTAQHMGLKVFVVSVVSNQCYPPDIIQETSVEDVLKVVSTAEPKMTLLVRKLLPFC